MLSISNKFLWHLMAIKKKGKIRFNKLPSILNKNKKKKKINGLVSKQTRVKAQITLIFNLGIKTAERGCRHGVELQSRFHD